MPALILGALVLGAVLGGGYSYANQRAKIADGTMREEDFSWESVVESAGWGGLTGGIGLAVAIAAPITIPLMIGAGIIIGGKQIADGAEMIGAGKTNEGGVEIAFGTINVALSLLGARSYLKARVPLAEKSSPQKLLNAAPDEVLNPTAQRLLGDGGVQERISAGRLLNAAPDEVVNPTKKTRFVVDESGNAKDLSTGRGNLNSVGKQTEYISLQETSAQSTNSSSVGLQNNIKGTVFENLISSRFSRIRRHPFFKPIRRGGIDLVSLEDGNVIINEAKFAERLQFDDFTAITKNLRSNIAEVIQNLRGHKGLSRADKQLIHQTLTEFLDNGNTPSNLRIRVVTGKSPVGNKLQNKIRNNTEGIPVEFEEY